MTVMVRPTPWLPGLIVALLAIGADGPSREAVMREEFARFALKTRGNPARGRSTFADARVANCKNCHRVAGDGGAIGPDLSNIGSKFARVHLIESVLEPSRQIVEGYRSTIISTSDGGTLMGLVKTETAEHLIVVDGQAHEQTIRKSDIDERKYANVSIMPEGLASGLSCEQFADLIAYLESLRSADQPTPGSGIVGPVILPPGFAMEKLVGGLTAATALAVSPDGQIFICEQTGALRVMKDGKLLPAPFVTLQVDSHWERGLIGVALAPRFPSNGYVYVTYVAAEPFPHHRISRFTARGDLAIPGSEVVLLRGDDQRKLGGTVPAGHQGGALHFGLDGKLYIAIGEQTAGAPAQGLDTFQGKLLRINPDGTIPPDNPFLSRTQGKYQAIWAIGLRNPFTFAVQPKTGRIFINDVGQNAWEEVDEGFAGANFGWPASEGVTHDPKYRGPIHVYPVASVSGAAFCPTGPDAQFPIDYQGRYFFMDFVKGWIKTLDPDHPGEAQPFATGLTRPVDLSFAHDGSFYVLLRDAWVIDDKFQPCTGSLLRINHLGRGP